MLVAQLKSFFMVARLGSITLAAKQLGLSQPTVTGRIRQLEEMYGVELFHRRGSRLDLSDLGVSLMPIVERLAHLRPVDAAIARMHELAAVVVRRERVVLDVDLLDEAALGQGPFSHHFCADARVPRWIPRRGGEF